jgi:general secretion pathway protein D
MDRLSAVVCPDVVDAVIRAPASSGWTSVLSVPKILVNDNASATLASVSEAPFTSINASDTVSTTSFAGYASAGTTVTLTPQISEGDHVVLDYAVTLNSFTGDGGGGVPPPRQTNNVSSRVTVPDGHAVIVGGLKRKDTTFSNGTAAYSRMI